MSQRQIRKIFGSNILPPPDSGSEDDRCKIMQSLYAGMRRSADYYNEQRLSVFRGTPIEVKQHLTAISAMSVFVLDGAVTDLSDRVFRELLTGDGIHRYDYPRPAGLYNGQ